MRERTILGAIGLCILCLLAYICFYRLGSFRLENWDEAWYADMMRNIIKTGNIAVMYWNRFPLLDKPPLYMWLGSVSALLLGLNEFAFRLPSAVAGFITVVLVTKFAARRWGVLAAIMAFGTLALNNVFMWRVRTANLDALATFLIVLVFFAAVSTNRKKYVWLGILFALIFLAKASLVVLPFALLFVSEVIYERKHIISNLSQYMPVIVVPLVLCGLWLAAGNMQLGSRFANYYLFHSDQNVARITIENFKTDYFMFAYYALQRRFMYPFVIGLVLLAVHIRKKESFLLISFSTALLFLLSFTERKNNWYLMPAMPFWSLVVGYGISETIRFFKKYAFAQATLIVFVLAIGGYIFFKTLTVNIMPLINTSGTENQAATALYIASHSDNADIVIRTDQLYPTTIYYSGLKTYAFDANAQLSDIGIGPDGLHSFLAVRKPIWISGTASGVADVVHSFMPGFAATHMYTRGDETVLKVHYR